VRGGISSIIRLTGEDIKGLVQMGMQFSAMGMGGQQQSAPPIDPATGLPVGFEMPEGMEMPENVEMPMAE